MAPFPRWSEPELYACVYIYIYLSPCVPQEVRPPHQHSLSEPTQTDERIHGAHKLAQLPHLFGALGSLNIRPKKGSGRDPTAGSKSRNQLEKGRTTCPRELFFIEALCVTWAVPRSPAKSQKLGIQGKRLGTQRVPRMTLEIGENGSLVSLPNEIQLHIGKQVVAQTKKKTCLPTPQKMPFQTTTSGGRVRTAATSGVRLGKLAT